MDQGVKRHFEEDCILVKNINYKRTKHDQNKEFVRTNNSGNLFVCQRCNYTTKILNILRIHIQRHLQEKPFQCDYCEYRAVTKSNMTTHQKKHFGNLKYKCDICKKEFTNLTKYERDLSTHLK